MKNIPIPVLTFLAVQLGGAIWWGAQIDAKVKLVEENRRSVSYTHLTLPTNREV